MKNTIIIGLLAGLAGGLVGSAVTGSLAPAGSELQAESKAPLGLEPGGEAEGDLLGRLEILRRETGELSMRLAALEARKGPASREAVPVNGDVDVAALQEQVMALASALQDPQSAQAAGLRNMVAGALKEVQEAESEKRRTEREQREIDRIVERMGEYAEKLGLDPVQSKAMQDVLIDSSAKRSALMVSMRDGTLPRGDIREAFTAMRDEVDTALRSILTPDQFEAYGEMSNEGGRFFGRGGRGGRGAER